jgi:hypothetical protein
MRIWNAFAGLLVAASLTGCASDGAPAGERGPDGTVPYMIHVESNEPGARVEVNDNYVGTTPLDVKVYGDKDGTFHNFGAADWVIRVNPVQTGQHVQTKTFRTGGWFSQEDQIPSRLYFDLNQESASSPPKPRY